MEHFPESSPVCSKCGGKMGIGFILDTTHGGILQSEWVQGPPERSRWSGIKMKRKVKLPVLTYRCSRCGYLDSYAPSA